jgi:uncharacterized protein YycO
MFGFLHKSGLLIMSGLVLLVTLYCIEFSTAETDSTQNLIEYSGGEIEFKRGDIIVRANHNNLIGTSFVENGSNFGHAAIVLEGAKADNVIDALKQTLIFESRALDVVEENQIRKVMGYKDDGALDSINLNFNNKYTGARYILRTNLPDTDIDKVIAFILDQDDCTSSYRATKDYKKSDYEVSRNWYCSLLLWQGFYSVLDIDIDVNKGLIVYPNDIINSPLFAENGTRIRF